MRVGGRVGGWCSSAFVRFWSCNQTRCSHPTCCIRLPALLPLLNPTHAEAVQLAIDGGATIVQLREKRADGGPFMQQASLWLCF